MKNQEILENGRKYREISETTLNYEEIPREIKKY
jgi:hypothetical protein